jgi:hypothetical protein
MGIANESIAAERDAGALRRLTAREERQSDDSIT